MLRILVRFPTTTGSFQLSLTLVPRGSDTLFWPLGSPGSSIGHICGAQAYVQAKYPYTLTNIPVTVDKTNLCREGMIWQVITHHWGNSSKSRGRNNGGMLLTGLLSSGLLSYFCFTTRAHLPGVTPPTAGWDTSHQVPTEKMSHRHAHGPIDWRQLLKWGFFLSGDSSLCQLGKN